MRAFSDQAAAPEGSRDWFTVESLTTAIGRPAERGSISRAITEIT